MLPDIRTLVWLSEFATGRSPTGRCGANPVGNLLEMFGVTVRWDCVFVMLNLSESRNTEVLLARACFL